VLIGAMKNGATQRPRSGSNSGALRSRFGIAASSGGARRIQQQRIVEDVAIVDASMFVIDAMVPPLMPPCARAGTRGRATPSACRCS
jgi:hypothetical protein